MQRMPLWLAEMLDSGFNMGSYGTVNVIDVPPPQRAQRQYASGKPSGAAAAKRAAKKRRNIAKHN